MSGRVKAVEVDALVRAWDEFVATFDFTGHGPKFSPREVRAWLARQGNLARRPRIRLPRGQR